MIDGADPSQVLAPVLVTAPSARRRSTIRNLAMDSGIATSVGVMTGLVATLLPPMGRQAGMGVAGLSLLAAVPYVAAVAGVASTRLGPRLPRDMFLTVAAGVAPVILLVVAPSAASILPLALTCWVAVWFLAPFQLRLWGRIYPPGRIGRTISVLGVARVVAGAVAAGLAGILASTIGAPTAVAAGLAVAVLLATSAFGFHTPRLEPAPRAPIRASVSAFVRDAGLRRLAVAQVIWGFGAGAAIALLPFVQVDRLGLSLADIGLVGVLAAAGAVVSYPLWGWLADRYGGVPVLTLATGVGAVGLGVWAFADGLVAVAVATTLLAVADAGIVVGQPMSVRERSDPGRVASHLAAWNGLLGVRGAVAPFLIAVPVAWGLMDVTGALVLCAVVSGVGCALFVAAARSAGRPAAGVSQTGPA